MALINAKNGIAAVSIALATATAASQALNAYLAQRQGKALADGLKPEFDSQQEDLQLLKEHLEKSQTELNKANEEIKRAQNELLKHQHQTNLQNKWMSIFYYVLGAATPLALK